MAHQCSPSMLDFILWHAYAERVYFECRECGKKYPHILESFVEELVKFLGWTKSLDELIKEVYIASGDMERGMSHAES